MLPSLANSLLSSSDPTLRNSRRAQTCAESCTAYTARFPMPTTLCALNPEACSGGRMPSSRLTSPILSVPLLLPSSERRRRILPVCWKRWRWPCSYTAANCFRAVRRMVAGRMGTAAPARQKKPGGFECCLGAAVRLCQRSAWLSRPGVSAISSKLIRRAKRR